MKQLVLLTLLFMTFGHIAGKNGDLLMSVVIQKCTGHCHPKYCNISIACRPLNRTSKFVSTDIYFHPGIKLEAPTYIEIITLKKFTTVYRPHMIRVKTELCNELSQKTHPLFKLFKLKTTSANLYDPCPITGHRHSQPGITNVYDYVTPYLPLMPAGEWRFDVIISQKRNGSEVVIVTWSDYYEIKALTAEQF